MAILGPSQLPVVLRVDSNPLKLHAISELGHPNVLIEMQEPQWEHILRSMGDFVAHHFPYEERYAFFYTNPLQHTYDLPQDAYWVREVAWDPVTSRIDDIFSAESFLFCFGSGVKILREDNEMISVDSWEKHFRAITPFGPKKLSITHHKEQQQLYKVIYEDGWFISTPNHPVKSDEITDMLNGWYEVSELKQNMNLFKKDGTSTKIIKIEQFGKGDTYSIYANGAHCLYASHDGLPVLVH